VKAVKVAVELKVNVLKALVRKVSVLKVLHQPVKAPNL
jgi:hypothetical protein